MYNLNKLLLAEIVILKPEAGVLLKSYGIDYTYKGNQTLEMAIGENEELLMQLKKELEIIFNITNKSAEEKLENASILEIINIIIAKHSHYNQVVYPTIFRHTQFLASKFNTRFPELIKIADLFAEIKKEQEVHMLHEEMFLFPKLKLSEKVVDGKTDKANLLDLIEAINEMKTEHKNVNQLVNEIKALTKNYHMPPDVSNNFLIPFMELEEFEKDLAKHIYIENNILVGKALALLK